jgi:hypothetical protein
MLAVVEVLPLLQPEQVEAVVVVMVIKQALQQLREQVEALILVAVVVEAELVLAELQPEAPAS